MPDRDPPPTLDVPADFAPPARRYVTVPPWLAGLLITVVTAGLAWGAWKWLGGGEKPVDLSQYESNDPGGGRGFGPRALPETVNLAADGNGIVRTAALTVRFQTSAAGKTTVMATGAVPRDLVPEDRQAVVARQAAMSLAYRQLAGVTDAQETRLRTIRLPEPPQMSPATREQLLSLWSKYKAADADARPAVEKELIETLRQTTATDVAADAKAYHAAAGEIRAVLSAEQIQKLRQRLPAPARAAATKPAAVRAASRPATRPRP